MSAKVPQIIYQQAFVNQSTALSPVTLVTPTSDATYRLSFYFEQGAGATFAFGQFDWTDDNGAQNQAGSSVSPGDRNIISLVVRATSGNAVTFKVTATGTINYSAYVIAEEL